MTISDHQEGRIWFIPRLRLAFCLTPKAASSSIKYALRGKFGSEKPEAGDNRILFRYKHLAHPYLGLYTRVAPVRCPWDRLASCYKDKVLTDQTEVKPYTLHHMGCYPNMSFVEFIKVVCDTPDIYMDKHVLPQYYLIQSPFWGGETDVLIRFETLATDWNSLRLKYPMLPSLGMYNKSDKKKPNWTTRTVNQVQNRYASDIALLGYKGPMI